MSIPAFIGNPPLVGRERELALLRAHRDAALAGHGGLVLISGEAGIGKTALAEAICREAERCGARILTGRCFDLAETPAYGPWLYLFERYRPGTDQPPHPPAFAEPGAVGAVGSPAVLLRQTLDFLRGLAASQPIVLLLDDLHWADPASLDLLRVLARSLDTLPLLVLAAYRADELTRPHPLSSLLPILAHEAHAIRLDLHPLDDAAVHALVAARYPLAEGNARRLTTYLQGRAEGNPFFLGELLRSLEERGVLREEGTGWTLGDLTRVTVPPLLRQVIESRLARLDTESQRLLALAAVIGHEAPFAVWVAVSGLDEETLLTVVDEGVRARLLVELPDGAGVQFGHALVREAIYVSIPAMQRRRQHRQVGEVLLREHHPDPDAIADHFQRSGDVRAAPWLIQAGWHAHVAYSQRMAIDRLEAARALCDEYDLDLFLRSRVTAWLADAYHVLDQQQSMQYVEEGLLLAKQINDRRLTAFLLIRRAWLRFEAQQTRAGLADLLAARTIVEQLTLEELGAIENPPYEMLASSEYMLTERLAYSEGHLTEYLAVSGRFSQAREIGERFVASAPTEKEAHLLPKRYQMALGNCYHGLQLSHIAQGESEWAARAAANALRYYQAAKSDDSCGEVTRVALLRLLTYRTDQPEERQRLVDEQNAFHTRWLHAVDIADIRLGQLPVLVLEGNWAEAWAVVSELPDRIPSRWQTSVRLTIGALARAQGNMQMAWSVVHELLPDGPIDSVASHFLYHAPALRLGASLALDAGDRVVAREWLGAHDELLTQCEAMLGQSERRALWAQYHRQAGALDIAFAHAERALAHATEPRQPLALLAAHRLLGELHTDTGSFPDAAGHLDAALQLADACAAPYERALTLLARAELLAATGDPAGAIMLLDAVRAICTPLCARPALDRADTLAASVATIVVPAYPDALTQREVEALRLIAQGRSNQEMAETLSISVRTVNRHIENLYRKIGAHGKADATAYAFRHRLT